MQSFRFFDLPYSLFRLTVGKLWPCLCCLFGQKRLLFSYIALSTSFFVPEKKKSLRLALERVEISLPACDLMLNRPPE